ncbi:probable serine/threonine-protein kinase DDB_G0278901 [Chrysoperla carnea]|uniref:probable serine/threonine-protein kinase DDB_G0278901 n=1 Tax=Chrysoperla carnea TaxID=189513 RepID=UPI001D079118|nr:probable serine/threonine-protein kinase DDB_G0278901 [Chrysoperla carnea]
MQFLSARLSDKKYTHIRSFRRYIFIHAEHPDIPEQIPIMYDNEQYRIFVTIDNAKCIYCDRFGHESNACKKQSETTNTTSTNPNSNSNANTNTDLKKPQTANPNTESNTTTPITIPDINNTNIPETQKPTPETQKNSPDTTIIPTTEIQNTDKNVNKSHTPKKRSRNNNSSSQESEIETTKKSNTTATKITKHDEDIIPATPNSSTQNPNEKKLREKQTLIQLIENVKPNILADPDQYMAKVRKEIKTEKQKSWNKFISSINSTTPDKIIWQNLRKLTTGINDTEKITAIETNNYITTNQSEIANEFGKYYEKVSDDTQYNQTFLHYKNQEEKQTIDFHSNEKLGYNEPFTEHEFSDALRQIKDSSPELREANQEVIFMWVPGHSGITGNELADNAAKAAHTAESLPPTQPKTI